MPVAAHPRVARAPALLLPLLLAALPAPTSAQTLVNGDMDGVADLSIFNGVVPPGWTTTNGSVDLMDETSTPAGLAWQPSTGGGTFVHGIGFAPGSESIGQLVSGRGRRAVP